MALTYVRDHDSGEAIFFDGKIYFREPSLTFIPDGKNWLSGSDDGTARLWDIATGNERAQLLSFSDGEWIIMTTDGYFTASPHGAKYVSVRIGDSVYPVDTMNKNLYEKYFAPARVISIVQGKS